MAHLLCNVANCMPEYIWPPLPSTARRAKAESRCMRSLRVAGVHTSTIILEVPTPNLSNDLDNGRVEARRAPKRSAYNGQHLILLIGVEAFALRGVEVIEPLFDSIMVLGLLAWPQHGHQYYSIQAASHVNESEDLHDTPQSLKVSRATEYDQLVATSHKDRQAPQVELDVRLIDATLVKPDNGFSDLVFAEVPPPLLQPPPLYPGIVMPRVGDESVTTTKLRGDAHRSQLWVRQVVCQLFLADVLQRDTAKTSSCLC
mmetsp:Transcript_23740/g.80257  ORF Transcript_23740/g.80257 Transcript_23740/m.80257 type:complete len:258 (-) Transcript_23740:864-1637(-)